MTIEAFAADAPTCYAAARAVGLPLDGLVANCSNADEVVEALDSEASVLRADDEVHALWRDARDAYLD